MVVKYMGIVGEHDCEDCAYYIKFSVIGCDDSKELCSRPGNPHHRFIPSNQKCSDYSSVSEINQQVMQRNAQTKTELCGQHTYCGFCHNEIVKIPGVNVIEIIKRPFYPRSNFEDVSNKLAIYHEECWSEMLLQQIKTQIGDGHVANNNNM